MTKKIYHYILTWKQKLSAIYVTGVILILSAMILALLSRAGIL